MNCELGPNRRTSLPLFQTYIQSLGIIYAGLTVAFFVLVERIDKILEGVKWPNWPAWIYTWSSRALIGLYFAFALTSIILGAAVLTDAQLIGLKMKIESVPAEMKDTVAGQLSASISWLEWWNGVAANSIIGLLLLCTIISLFISLHKMDWIKRVARKYGNTLTESSPEELAVPRPRSSKRSRMPARRPSSREEVHSAGDNVK